MNANRQSRWFWLPGGDIDIDPEHKMRLFMLVAVMAYIGERIAYYRVNSLVGNDARPYLWFVLLGVIALIGLIRGRSIRPWVGLCFVANVIEIRYAWHGYANHGYLLASVLFVILVLWGRSLQEQRLTLQVLRWQIIAVVVGSAIQKLAHGAWTGGAFLAMTAAAGPDSYAWAYHLFGLDAELARIQSWTFAAGSGPYASEAWQITAMSNMVWLMELVLPLCLLLPRRRTLAVWLLMGFIVLIQAIAAEWFFAILAINLLVLYFPAGFAVRSRWVLLGSMPVVIAATASLIARYS